MTCSPDLIAFATEQLREALRALYDDPGGWDSDREIRDLHARYLALADELGVDVTAWLVEDTTPFERDRLHGILH